MEQIGLMTPFKILMDPVRFFRGIRDDAGYLKPWAYSLVVMGIYLGFIMVYASLLPAPEDVNDTLLYKSIFLMMMFLILALVLVTLGGLVFVNAAITHAFLMIVGSDKGYQQTFKLVCYSMTGLLLSAPLVLLNLMEDGGMASFMLSIPFGIYVAIISVFGAMELHRISAMKAVGAMILIPIGMAVLLFAFFVILIAAMIVPAMSSNAVTGAVTGLM
jgi:hypothetical protein